MERMFWANDLKLVYQLTCEINETTKTGEFLELRAASVEVACGRQEPKDELLSVWHRGVRVEIWEAWTVLCFQEFEINTESGKYKISTPKLTV